MRRIGLLIAAVLAFAALPGCKASNGDPDASSSDTRQLAFAKYKEPVELTVGMGVDPTYKSYTGESADNNPWVHALREELNIQVRISWMVANSNMEQRMELAIASNTLPDAMVVSRQQLLQMVKADELADLTRVYREYASPVMKGIIESTGGTALNQATFDGKLLAIPCVEPEDVSLLWIREDWLERLGYSIPATMEELEQVARAFVEQDPDGNGKADTIGIASSESLYDDFQSGPASFNLNPIFSAYHAYPGFWMRDGAGEPVYGSIQPEVRTALAKLRALYAAGLLDKELGLRESPAEPVINGKAGIFFAPYSGGYWPIPEMLKNNPRADWRAYALPLDADGEWNPKVFLPTQSYIVVRKGYNRPDAVVKAVNLLLRDESKYGIDFRPLPIKLAPRDEISVTVKALTGLLDGTRTSADYRDKEAYTLLQNDLGTVKDVKLPPYDDMSIASWDTRNPNFKRVYSLLVGGRNLLDVRANKMESVYSDYTETMEKQWRHLFSYEMELFTQIIMGVAPLDAFDEWVQRWQAEGGEQISAEISRALRQEGR